MKNYPESVQETMVKKITTPGGPNCGQLSKEVGIPHQTLSRWVRKYSSIGAMDTKEEKRGWSVEDKLRIVSEVQGMSEAEFGEYLRRNGLHSAEIESWKEAFIKGAKKLERGRPKKDPELIKLQKSDKALRKELRRKDRALAEASALLILKKKAEAIWGADEDDE